MSGPARIGSENQDETIKSRKGEVYAASAPEVAEPAPALSSRRTFQDYLRETPAAPLPGSTKAALGAAGLAVVGLLAASFLVEPAPRPAGPGGSPGPAGPGGSPVVAGPAVSKPTGPTILLAAGDAPQAPETWRYTTDKPAGGWEKPGFPDGAWKRGPGGFGSPGAPGLKLGTPWNTSDIWLRTTVEVPKLEPGDILTLRVLHDDGADVFVNGRKIYGNGSWRPSMFEFALKADQKAAFRPGPNTVAVHGSQIGGGQALDVGLELTPATVLAAAASVTPTAWYRLDEPGGGSVADAGRGPAAPGTVRGGVTPGTGPDRGAMLFSGSGSSIDLGNPAKLNFAGKITLAVWVKPADLGGGGLHHVLTHGGANNPSREVFLRLSDGLYQAGSWDGVDHMVGFKAPPGDRNAWVHLAGVYDGATWRLYRNGQEVASRGDGIGALQVGVNWTIGDGAGSSAGRFFKGGIGDVRIYDSALPAPAIAALASRRPGG